MISFELSVKNYDYGSCATELSQLTELLRKELESVGVARDNLKTGQLSVSTEFNFTGGRRVFAGYTASHDLKLEFPFDTGRLNLVLGQLSRSQSKAKFDVRFTVKDLEPLRNVAMAEAVKAARTKASLLAETAGVSLGKILQIDYSWSDIYLYSTPMELPMALNEASPEYDITPEDIQVEESVNVVWEISW